jgi:uncharacterized damage-inducible protein DinB
MTPAELLTDSLERVRESVTAVLDGLTLDDLTHRPTADANSIGWLVWHLTRVQDVHVSELVEAEEVWVADGFADRFDLPYDTAEHGYGHSSEQVGAFRAEADLLGEYYDAVHRRTLEYVAGLTPEDLDQVVDERWDPPVTLGVRLVSVVNDDTQHVGQAAYVRGLLGS